MSGDGPEAPGERVERVPVGSFANRAAAELARSWLADQHDLDVLVTADDTGGSSPEIGFAAGGARLLVARHEADQVAELLAALPPEVRTPQPRRPLARLLALALVVVLAVIGSALLVALLLLA